MGYRSLFIWVEGEDDERFFEKIMKPKLQKKYKFIETIRYATLKKEKIDNFLKSIKAMGADYIFVTDINDSPCVTAKKQKIDFMLEILKIFSIDIAKQKNRSFRHCIEKYNCKASGNVDNGR